MILWSTLNERGDSSARKTGGTCRASTDSGIGGAIDCLAEDGIHKGDVTRDDSSRKMCFQSIADLQNDIQL